MKNINKNCKKYFYILFTLLFFTSVFTLTGISKEEAAATETSTATYSSATPQISYSVTGNKTVGSTITIAVNVTNGANIYGGSLDLLFDSNMLEITSAQMGSLFEKDLKAPLINDTKTPGRTSVVITLSGANKKLSVTNGSLVIINAKIKKAGTLNLKTTNDFSKLSLNGCTSCIKLSNSRGKALSYECIPYSTTLNIKQELSLDAKIVSSNIPTTMTTYNSYPVTIKVKNTGTSTWTKRSRVSLGIYEGNSNFNVIDRIFLQDTDSIKPGETATFTTILTSPSTTGNYNFSIRMVQDGVAWFGDRNTSTINVKADALDSKIISNNIPRDLDPNTIYPVTVKVKNTGTSTWTKSSAIRLGIFEGNTNFNIIDRVYLKDTDSIKPGEIATFTFNITSPAANGTYKLNMRMVKEHVAWFGDFNYSTVNVSNSLTLNGQIISNNIPNNMKSYITYPVTIKVKNTGTSTWTKRSRVSLGIYEGNSNFNVIDRIFLQDTDSIKPGETATFTTILTSPSISGKYNFNVRMVKDGVTWFGDKNTSTINVTTDALDAKIISNTIPKTMSPNTKYTITIKVMNIGSSTWTKQSRFNLGIYEGNANFNIIDRVYLQNTDSIKPGNVATFTAVLTSPSVAGNYNFNVRMVQDGVAWFGDRNTSTISVKA